LASIRQQLAFLAELDRLKSVVRQSPLVDRSRKESSAEHSWHLAMFAFVLVDSVPGADALYAVKLLLIHDIVEINAGDAPIHVAGKDKAALEQAEQQAAKRIFGLLPAEQGKELLTLWNEFEEARTPAARFAEALDRLQPLFLNTLTDGGNVDGKRHHGAASDGAIRTDHRGRVSSAMAGGIEAGPAALCGASLGDSFVAANWGPPPWMLACIVSSVGRLMKWYN
jgi:putative hydrolase of HD superfamily